MSIAAMPILTSRLNAAHAEMINNMNNQLRTGAAAAGGECSAAVETGQCRLRQGMEVQIEADQRGRRRIVLGIRQLVDVDGKNRDLVTMRFVASRRTRAAIAIGAEIGAALDCALGRQLLLHVAGALGQRRREEEA